MECRTEHGRKLRIVNLIDEYARECLSISIEPSVLVLVVIEILEWSLLIRGAQKYIRSDNVPGGCRQSYLQPLEETCSDFV